LVAGIAQQPKKRAQSRSQSQDRSRAEKEMGKTKEVSKVMEPPMNNIRMKTPSKLLAKLQQTYRHSTIRKGGSTARRLVAGSKQWQGVQ
jgi:hypothetical protein